MFERILLPLDGSQSSEVAIPYVEFLSRRLGSEVVLFHAGHFEQEPYRHMHQIYLDHIAEEMRRKIKRGWLGGGEPMVQAEALIGEPVEAIHDYVEKNAIGMVVMATSGGSGIKAWILGSVTDRISRIVTIPTLIIRAGEGHLVQGKKRLAGRIFLPLDGSDASKVAVPYALELAKKLKASITLFGMAQKVT